MKKIMLKKKVVKKAAVLPPVTTAAAPAPDALPASPAVPTPKAEPPVKIVVSKSFGGLSEIYQSMSTKFALLRDKKDGTFEQITPPVQCRDFIGDVYTSTHQKAIFGIYGMSWDGTKNSPDMDGFKLLVKTPSAAAKTSLLDNVRFVHAIEDKNGIPRSQVIDNGGSNVVIFGDKRWLSNVLYVSLYTFLWRVMCYKITSEDWISEVSGKGVSDSKYISSIKTETWTKILDNLSLIDTPEFCAMSVAKDVSAVHHNAGFISTFGTHSEISYSTVKTNPHYLLMASRGIFTESRF